LPQNRLEVISHSPEETQSLGRVIGKLVQGGDIILLSGVLGAGKTCLAQGIAHGLGIAESTPSPSFVLMREFNGRLPLYHMDLYRLEPNEVEDLGLDDYLYGKGVCIIEWAEKGMALFPPEHLLINLSYLGDNERRIELAPKSERYLQMLPAIKQATSQTTRGK